MAAQDREARISDHLLPADGADYPVQRAQSARGRVADRVSRLLLGVDDRDGARDNPVRVPGRRVMASAVAKVLPRAAADRDKPRLRRSLAPLVLSQRGLRAIHSLPFRSISP